MAEVCAMKAPMDLGRLGISGVIGFAVLLSAMSFGLGTVVPAHRQLEQLTKAEKHLQASTTPIALRSDTASSRPPPVPPISEAPRILQDLAATAEKYQLPLDQATYRFLRQDTVARYEVSVPLKGNYIALRGFLMDALALSPTATLDELSLRRGSASDPVLEATFRLSYPVATP